MLKRRPKRSRRGTLRQLRETLPAVFTEGIFESIGWDLDLEEVPERGEQEEMLWNLAPTLIGVRDPAKVDALVRGAIRYWLISLRQVPPPQGAEGIRTT